MIIDIPNKIGLGCRAYDPATGTEIFVTYADDEASYCRGYRYTLNADGRPEYRLNEEGTDVPTFERHGPIRIECPPPIMGGPASQASPARQASLPMPVINLTDHQAARSIPAIRHAMKAANFPGWVKTAFAAILKYAPTIIAIIVQLAPLFATPADHPGGVGAVGAGPDGSSDVIDDPALRPECRAALLAARAGAFEA